MKKFIDYWKDNLRRPSTYAGFGCLLLGYGIYQDKAIMHQLLENIVGNSDFVKMLVGLVSGSLIAHRQADKKKDDEENS